MPVQFRSDQSPTPCATCGHFTKGKAGKFCGKKPGHYFNFIKFKGKIKLFNTRCKISTHKDTKGAALINKDGKFVYPCISVWNPWAWAIPYFLKDIENRTWSPRWKGKPLRGEILIHAAKKRMSDQVWAEFQYRFKTDFGVDLPDKHHLQFGGIVGKANLIDCVTESDSKWKESGSVGWVLKDQKPITFIPYRGQQNIFEYHSDIKL